MSTPCCACDKPDAGTLLRIVPRRDVEPLTIEMARATAWPGSAMPVSVPYCGAMPCKDAIRSVATVVLAETVIEETQSTETTA
jgi:hypothetical protein